MNFNVFVCSAAIFMFHCMVVCIYISISIDSVIFIIIIISSSSSIFANFIKMTPPETRQSNTKISLVTCFIQHRHSPRPLYGTKRRLCDSDGWIVVSWGGDSDDQIRGCGDSSVKQTLWSPIHVAQLSLQTVAPWSIFYTHTATCINELPVCP